VCQVVPLPVDCLWQDRTKSGWRMCGYSNCADLSRRGSFFLFGWVLYLCSPFLRSVDSTEILYVSCRPLWLAEADESLGKSNLEDAKASRWLWRSRHASAATKLSRWIEASLSFWARCHLSSGLLWICGVYPADLAYYGILVISGGGMLLMLM